MVQRLSHATFYVLDQDKAKEFYVDKLGFSVHTDVTMDGGFRWLTVTAPGDPDLEINLMAAGPPVFNDEQSKMILSLLQAGAMGAAVMNTDDCRKTYEELKAKGVEFKGEPEEQFYGTEVIMLDGCGNWFSLTSPKG